MTDYRDLPPVEENVERPEAYGQTFLARMDVCARSGFLYQRHRGGPASHQMERGTAFHEAARRFVDLLIENGENTGPPEIAKDLLVSVFEEHPELQVPEHERDALRFMMQHLAENLWIDPSKIVGVEKTLTLEIAGVTIRGKVDLAFVFPEQRHAEVWDWKTSWAMPSQEDFEKSFQTRDYALMLLDGIGDGDAVPMGRGVDTVKVMEIYPRYKDLPHREAILDRQQLLDFRQTVETTIARAEHGFETGKWQAVPGSHCSECPAMYECPLPAELIPAAPPDADPQTLAERWLWLTEEASRVKKLVKAAAEDRPERSIALGTDLELTFTLRESESVKKGKLPEIKAALEAAGYDPSDYITKTTSSNFDKRRVPS